MSLHCLLLMRPLVTFPLLDSAPGNDVGSEKGEVGYTWGIPDCFQQLTPTLGAPWSWQGC